MRGMDDLPKPADGRALAARRRELGVTQKAVAEALGVHRLTLNDWERTERLDAIRAARYERALVALVSKAVA